MRYKCHNCGQYEEAHHTLLCHTCGTVYCEACYPYAFDCIVCGPANHNHSHYKMTEERKMATLKEEAKAFTPGTTKNIAELDKVSVDLDLAQETYTDKEDKEFTVKYIVVNGDKYRVPNSVLASLKAILEKRPNLKAFSVVKQGTGLNTSYQVLPEESVEIKEEKVQ